MLIGCGEINYYRQAVLGQWHLLAQRRDIEKLIAAEQTPAELKQRLELVQEIRDFAGTELLLPDNRSYRTYADLKRPYAVWNVVAAPSLSVDPLTWCFPVAGCVPYRGYFDQGAAQRFAQGLEGQGYDVHVYGVAAYSTLNWFDDPVLNTFVHYPEAQLAGLIFHELAHQQLYIKGNGKNDGAFNESFAQMVEQVGVERWLLSRRQQDKITVYRQYRSRQQEFIELVLQTRQELENLYQSDLAEDIQLATKNQLLTEFHQRYATLKQQWDGDGRFDGWVARPLNNSHFALVATYHTYVPAFFALLEQSARDLPSFYQKAAELAALAPTQRDAILQTLLNEND
ncbi:MAG: aminopeptidase [Desulfuromonadales bacterium]|nr:aminopeptidase [Desulfuromonadales bacterium]